ncbi:MAG: response regulator transcription factor [Roseburia sp.]|nr:response regulator transcription factor [Roseburia sp.]
MERILIVDEDVNNRTIVKNQLTKAGYQVSAKSFIEDVERRKLGEYDLILAELMETSCDAYGFITKLKETAACPVIICSARTNESAIVDSLLAGADDYVAKPFRMPELTARIKVALQKNTPRAKEEDVISGMVFNSADNSVIAKEGEICMTRNEFRLCRILAKNRSMTFSKESLYEYIYEVDADTQLRTITEYIYSVRKKFKEIQVNPIKTVWGMGYRWAYVDSSLQID